MKLFTRSTSVKTGLAVLLLALLSACTKEELSTPGTPGAAGGTGTFNYLTTKKVTIALRLLSNLGEPLKGVPVAFYSGSDQAPLLKAVSNSQGYINTDINIASYISELVVAPNYAGIVDKAAGYFVNNRLELTLGGPAGVSGNVASLPAYSAAKIRPESVSSTNFYMGAHDLNGRPLYLESQRSPVTEELLSYINFSLPGQKDLRQTHADYLSSAASSDINIVETGDVYITFVSESAGNNNAIGYYTYPTNDPPENVAGIETINYIFPNSSAYGSGGGLLAGDCVKLGRFSAGTSIGFVIFSGGWSSLLKLVNASAQKFYSTQQLNPETASLKRHSVLLNYEKGRQYVIGFEDVNRETAGCDNDFNDLVLYATATPATAISTSGVKPLDSPTDTDKDGVTDAFDEFPTDATKAYTNYYPSKNTWGTLAFEDNWPLKGDYDMNDLLVNYRYSIINNSSNQAVEITGNYTATAALAAFKNGFGVQFPFAPSAVSSVSGYKHTSGYVTLNANGTEAGQAKAVIIPFDNQEGLLKASTGRSDTLSVNVKFTKPLSYDAVGSAPFNPFLISNRRRAYEIHLAGNAPTDKAASSLFGQYDDRSDASANRYYIDSANRPWALNFTEPFSFPKEGSSIYSAYLHFNEWAASDGSAYPDWYKNTAAGYRASQNIY